MSEPISATAVVLERNLRVGQRIARVIGSAIGFEHVSCIDRAGDLRDLVGPQTRLIACGEGDAERVANRFCSSFPELRLLVWTSEEPARVIALAQAEPKLSNILGWPSFQSMPRPWELLMTTRRLVDPYAPSPGLHELLRWGATFFEWTPSTTIDRDVVVAEVSQLVLQVGASSRLADRIAEVAHELLMNAMYDAPIDENGRPRYAYDRTQDIVLGASERPTLRFATDGMLLGLQVIDPFGGLQRWHVVDGITRGLFAPEHQEMKDIVDTSHGGAGLGMAKLYKGSSILVVDVMPGASTTVTSLHELDISPRELRSLPGSLHYFAR